MSQWRKCDHCGKEVPTKEGSDIEVFIGNKFMRTRKVFMYGDICNGCIKSFVSEFESKGFVLEEDCDLYRERIKEQA